MSPCSDLADLPLISVVIPAYNAELWVTRTLSSVLAQTYRNLEVWVIDDGSIDRTAVVVEQIIQQDGRVRLIRQANAGVAAARNRGIQAATGDWIAPLDADDLWYPDHLAQQVACAQAAPPTVGLIYSWSIDIDAADRPLQGFHAAEIHGSVYPTLLCHNFLGNASCTLIRRSVLLAVGGYDQQFQARQVYGCEDWDLYLRIAAVAEFQVVPQFSVGYRKLTQSMSYQFDRMARSHALMLEKVRQQCPQLPPLLYRLSRSSLYLYFAHQCSAFQDDRQALHWLRAAVRADISPWFRLGTYVLAAKSGFNLRRSRSTVAQPLDQATSVTQKGVPAKLPSRLKLGLKLLVGKTLHVSLARFDVAIPGVR